MEHRVVIARLRLDDRTTSVGIDVCAQFHGEQIQKLCSGLQFNRLIHKFDGRHPIALEILDRGEVIFKNAIGMPFGFQAENFNAESI